MPARDLDQEKVKRALVQDGWSVTHDPLRVLWGARGPTRIFIPLEGVLGAEKGVDRIAVEVKGFIEATEIDEIGQAIGQYILREQVLHQCDPGRRLYWAVRPDTIRTVFEDAVGQILFEGRHLRLRIFDEVAGTALTWKH